MPAWAIRAGTAVIRGLFGDDASNNTIVTVILALLLLLMAFLVILFAPLAFLILPLADDGQLAQMQMHIASLEANTSTPDDPYGVSIPWTEVVAVYAILHDQDFEQIDQRKVHSLAGNWLEYHEEDIWEQDKDGKLMYVETITWYTVKSLPTVLSQFGFEEEDIERVDAMIATLTEQEI